jgi:hypothetical protein
MIMTDAPARVSSSRANIVLRSKSPTIVAASKYAERSMRREADPGDANDALFLGKNEVCLLYDTRTTTSMSLKEGVAQTCIIDWLQLLVQDASCARLRPKPTVWVLHIAKRSNLYGPGSINYQAVLAVSTCSHLPIICVLL